GDLAEQAHQRLGVGAAPPVLDTGQELIDRRVGGDQLERGVLLGSHAPVWQATPTAPGPAARARSPRPSRPPPRPPAAPPARRSRSSPCSPPARRRSPGPGSTSGPNPAYRSPSRPSSRRARCPTGPAHGP